MSHGRIALGANETRAYFSFWNNNQATSIGSALANNSNANDLKNKFNSPATAGLIYGFTHLV